MMNSPGGGEKSRWGAVIQQFRHPSTLQGDYKVMLREMAAGIYRRLSLLVPTHANYLLRSVKIVV